MDDYDKAGLRLAPEVKQRLAALRIHPSVVIAALTAPKPGALAQAVTEAAANLRKLGDQIRALQANPDQLPTTGSKGHWRDVIPRGRR